MGSGTRASTKVERMERWKCSKVEESESDR